MRHPIIERRPKEMWNYRLLTIIRKTNVAKWINIFRVHSRFECMHAQIVYTSNISKHPARKHQHAKFALTQEYGEGSGWGDWEHRRGILPGAYCQRRHIRSIIGGHLTYSHNNGTQLYKTITTKKMCLTAVCRMEEQNSFQNPPRDRDL